MNKKIFAIIMVIALILSSFTLAFANNSEENKEKKDKPGNRKIHVHIEGNRDDIKSVEVEIDDKMYKLEPNGNSGNYTTTKVGDTVSVELSKIIVYTEDGMTEFDPANKEQQGQEGQGSINYRITVTESNDDLIDDDDDIIEVTIDAEEDESDGDDTVVDESDDDSENSDAGGQEGSEEQESVEEGEQEEADEFNGDLDDDSDNDSDENPFVENITEGSTPNSDTPDSTESIVNTDNTITVTTEETPQGTPELEPQEISTAEETPVETEIETKTLDLEDEETPLDIPSTGVTTPLFYGAGALISLVGLLKRR
ncbi:MAG: hypothetical protein KMY55_14005 [Dethiosulfatibacter sp.]|nr:hypothetical protein [Dethiosulfatibacter sp.]